MANTCSCLQCFGLRAPLAQSSNAALASTSFSSSGKGTHESSVSRCCDACCVGVATSSSRACLLDTAGLN